MTINYYKSFFLLVFHSQCQVQRTKEHKKRTHGTRQTPLGQSRTQDSIETFSTVRDHVTRIKITSKRTSLRYDLHFFSCIKVFIIYKVQTCTCKVLRIFSVANTKEKVGRSIVHSWTLPIEQARSIVPPLIRWCSWWCRDDRDPRRHNVMMA